MKNLNNKVAAITGAASGIGRMLAVCLARENCHVAIADVNKEGLQETRSMIGKNVNVSVHTIDVSDYKQVQLFADDAVAWHGGVDIIINNAAVLLGDFLDTVTLEDFHWLMNINFWGVVHGTMAFLPYLQKRPEGHVVNISSINGIMPNPNNGPYCSAKYAVKGYTETLYQEMRGTSIHVSCVHPGGIKTNIARNARVKNTLSGISADAAAALYDEEVFHTSAESAARDIIRGIRKNNPRIMVGLDAQIMDFLTRMFPKAMIRLAERVTTRVAGKYAGS